MFRPNLATLCFRGLNDILYISPSGINAEGAGAEKPEKINIKIQDERIRTVNKIIIRGEFDYFDTTIWDRQNGFIGFSGSPGMGGYGWVGDIIPCIVNVKYDCVEVGGYFNASAGHVFSGYSYIISDNVLYIIPEINWGDNFRGSGLLHVLIQDYRIPDIQTIILGREDDEDRQTIWDRENGFPDKVKDRQMWDDFYGG